MPNDDMPMTQRSLIDAWLFTLSSSDRSNVYALTAALVGQTNGLTQENFLLQYAAKKRDWQRDFRLMFDTPKKKPN